MHLTPEDAMMIKLILVLWGVAGLSFGYVIYRLVKKILFKDGK
jgi:hypothetical protein